MKFPFFKKEKKLPSLKSLRPRIFNVDLFWFASLGLFLIVLVIASLVGLKLFYSQYSESYKEIKLSENFENIINIENLKSAIESRNDFINKTISLPRNPSL